MADQYSNRPFQKSTSPIAIGIAVTPGATAYVNGPAVAIWADVAGSITITDRGGNSTSYVIPAGQWIPMQSVALTAATATGIKIGY